MIAYSIILLLIVLALASFTLVGCSKTDDKNTPVVSSQQVKSLSKSELKEMLDRIERSEIPKLKMGAMCYDMCGPPKRTEYICPTCGDKTLYTNRMSALISFELPRCRREMEKIKKLGKLNVSLDESSFCRKCKPDETDPRLMLNICYSDGSTNVYYSVNDKDIRILHGLLQGKLCYETFNEGTSPLKYELERLRGILGLAQDEGGE